MPELLPEVYRLVEADERFAASDLVLDTIDRMLSGGQFRECDAIIEAVDLRRLPSALRRMFLCVTFPAKDQLNYSSLFDRALAVLKEERGEEVANRLLRTLRP